MAGLLATVVLGALLAGCGSEDPQAATTAEPVRRAYVDRDSVGGRCDDERSAEEAASAQTPWCSLDRAAREAAAGTTVLVRQGAYPRLVLDGVNKDDVVAFTSAPGETATLDGFELRDSSRLRFQRLRFRGHSNLVGPGNDRIELLDSDLTVSTQVRPSTNLRFEGNTIHDLPGPPGANVDGVGIWMATGAASTTIEDVVVRGNRFSRLPNDAIYTDGERVLIEDNVFEEIRSPDNDWTHADVIQSQGADNLTIRGNFARDNDSGILNSDSRVHGWVIENNVFVRSESQPLQLDNQLEDLRLVNNTFWDGGPVFLRWDENHERNPTGFVIVNNLVTRLDVDPRLNIAVEDYNLIGEDPFDSPVRPHSKVGVKPRFADPARDDYSLVGTSPGVDQGTSAHGAPRTDRTGQPRYDVPRARNTGGGPQRFFDVGAYETGAGTADRGVPRLRVSTARAAAGDGGLVGLTARCDADCRLTATGHGRRARGGRTVALKLRLGARAEITARFRHGAPARRTVRVPIGR